MAADALAPYVARTSAAMMLTIWVEWAFVLRRWRPHDEERHMLPIIMLPDGDLPIVLHLVPFWILTIWGSVHIEETVVGWRNQLRMKTSAT